MVPYGGFWWRVLAYFIDAIVLRVVLSILGAVLGLGLLPGMANGNYDNPSMFTPVYFTFLALSVVGSLLYFPLMESSKFQGTLGKMAVGLVVTDLDGQRISFARAIGRYFAKILSGLILCIGYIMIGFNARKQGLHDLIAGTLVYKTRDPSEVSETADVFA